MLRRLRVGVVFGGRSAEHEVSIASARTVLAALDPDRYEAVPIGIDREGRWHLGDARRLLEGGPDLPRGRGSTPPALSPAVAGDPGGAVGAADAASVAGAPEVALVPRGRSNALVDLEAHRDLGTLDVVFPVLHGPYGEDGSVQGLCRLAGIPCVGAGVLGSAVGMDKDVMKRLLRDAGIPTARFVAVERSGPRPSVEEVAAALGPTVFVKPANLGSSVGVSKARDAAGLEAALGLAFRYDTKAVIEECIVGRELECSVLGNDDPAASVPGEVLPAHEFYDYEAKYLDEHGAALEIPARLDPATVGRVRDLAVRAFRVLCASGMARVDLFLEPGGRLVVNEINTIPGFTRISMYPKLWEASGMPYRELVDRLIALALERHETERSLATTV
jgi:D-alanine-D-alanine ligase